MIDKSQNEGKPEGVDGYEKKLSLTDLVRGFSRLRFDEENELVSKSPTRSHEVHRCSKPYGQGSSSRYFSGITRVAESDEKNRGDEQQATHSLSSTASEPIAGDPDRLEDVGLRDVNLWLELCSRCPKVLEDFVTDFNKELDKKEVPSVRSDGRELPSQQQQRQCSTDGMNISSGSSSQISSPAQSPSECVLTSPESVGWEENSLYHGMPPSVPALDFVNIKTQNTRAEEVGGLPKPPCTKKNGLPCQYSNSNIVDASGANDSYSDVRHRSEILSTNIGTVMLNLAEDSYESTIDLSKYAKGWNSDITYAYEAVEKACLNGRLDPKKKQSTWVHINQFKIDTLGEGDAEGDTQLMILVASNEITLESIYVLVEKFLSEKPEYLSSRNNSNQDALYLAALQLKREPIVASYIAEAMIIGRQDVNRMYDGGDSLLHCLAKKGDSHANVLERLMRLKNHHSGPAFDVDAKNNRGYTPLHVACEVHKPGRVWTYRTVRILLENGADLSNKEYIDENTPLHVLINESCDPEILKALLENWKIRRKVNVPPTLIPNRQGNTALHLACRRNSLPLALQKEVVEILMRYGAMIQLKNINGCVPSVLVDTSRKQEIKNSLHSFYRK